MKTLIEAARWKAAELRRQYEPKVPFFMYPKFQQSWPDIERTIVELVAFGAEWVRNNGEVSNADNSSDRRTIDGVRRPGISNSPDEAQTASPTGH